DVDQRLRPQPAGKAQPPGDAGQPLGPDMIEPSRAVVIAEEVCGQTLECSQARSRKIALNADDPVARELIIAADLAAKKRAAGIQSGRTTTGRAGGKNFTHLFFAPAPAAVSADKAAGPTEDRNRRRGFVNGPRQVGSIGGARRNERAGRDRTE